MWLSQEKLQMQWLFQARENNAASMLRGPQRVKAGVNDSFDEI